MKKPLIALAFLAAGCEGRYAATESPEGEILLSDRETGVTTVLSAGLDGSTANGSSRDPVFSEDGDWAVFLSTATNLVRLPYELTPGIERAYAWHIPSGTLLMHDWVKKLVRLPYATDYQFPGQVPGPGQ